MDRVPATRPDLPARSEAPPQDQHFDLWLERNLAQLLTQLVLAFDEAPVQIGPDPHRTSRPSS